MAKLRLGYKVLRENDGNLISSTTDARETIYRFEEWTFPIEGAGPLAVFKSRKAARNHKKGLDYGTSITRRIFRCLYEPSREVKVWWLNKKEGFTVGELESFAASGIVTPGHTRLAKRVFLFREDH